MGTLDAHLNEFPYVLLAEGAAPATPATGFVRLYVKADGLLYWKDDAGTEYAVGQGDTAGHLADTADAHDASAISFTPAGTIAATDVQAAIEEVASEAGGGASSELDYVEFTASVSVTQTVEASADTVVTAGAEVFDGSTVAMIEFFSPFVRPAATALASVTLYLYDGASSIGAFGVVQTPSANNANRPVVVRRRLTPSAASHTYSVRATVSTGTGTVGAGAGGSGNNVPGYIRITRV